MNKQVIVQPKTLKKSATWDATHEFQFLVIFCAFISYFCSRSGCFRFLLIENLYCRSWVCSVTFYQNQSLMNRKLWVPRHAHAFQLMRERKKRALQVHSSIQTQKTSSLLCPCWLLAASSSSFIMLLLHSFGLQGSSNSFLFGFYFSLLH